MLVYIIWNKNKDLYYVGQAKSISSRLLQHFDLPSIVSEDAIFKVIESVRLDQTEREWISILKQDGKTLLNKTIGNKKYFQ